MTKANLFSIPWIILIYSPHETAVTGFDLQRLFWNYTQFHRITSIDEGVITAPSYRVTLSDIGDLADLGWSVICTPLYW